MTYLLGTSASPQGENPARLQFACTLQLGLNAMMDPTKRKQGHCLTPLTPA